MNYEDFHIRFAAKGDNRYKIRVESPAGNDSAEIELTYSIDEMLPMLQALGQSVRSSEAVEDESGTESGERGLEIGEADVVQPDEVGKQLYRDLFAGAAASKFDQALGMVQGRNAGLRVKLHIDPNDSDVARLAGLPWELLCDPNKGDQPLSLTTETPLIRYLDAPVPRNKRPFQPPLRVLVVVADPDGVAALDLTKERRSIEESWGNRPDVEVRFLEKATVHELSNELARNDYHVLHYMGHGGFDEKNGVGVLLMENDSGQPDAVDGRTLGVTLRDAKSIRLVFLNACNTGKLAKEEGRDPYAGVATALVMAGVPAVVAMQFPISDKAAIAFAGCLYPRLVQGYPLDGAVAEARKAIRLADRKSMEWSTPVLFMSSPDGRLFDLGRAEKGSGAPKVPKWRRIGIAAAIMAVVGASAYVAAPLILKYPLAINVTPYGANVEVVGYTDHYERGLKLRSGKYELIVSADDYFTQSVMLDHRAGVAPMSIELVPVPREPDAVPVAETVCHAVSLAENPDTKRFKQAFLGFEIAGEVTSKRAGFRMVEFLKLTLVKGTTSQTRETLELYEGDKHTFTVAVDGADVTYSIEVRDANDVLIAGWFDTAEIEVCGPQGFLTG